MSAARERIGSARPCASVGRVSLTGGARCGGPTSRDCAPGGWRRGLTTLMPVAVPLAMGPVFKKAIGHFGPERGYQVGFGVYWATCWAVAGALAGPRRLASLWQRAPEPLPQPRGLALSVLAAPAVGAIITEWLPHARRAGPGAVAVAAGVGITNALAEEALWRGLPVAVFPDDPVRGWLWPAAGFTAWHLVPLAARSTSARRRLTVLLGAGAIGVGYGWIAWRTLSLNAVAPVHALTDSCGVRPASTIWLLRPVAARHPLIKAEGRQAAKWR